MTSHPLRSQLAEPLLAANVNHVESAALEEVEILHSTAAFDRLRTIFCGIFRNADESLFQDTFALGDGTVETGLC